MSNGRPTSPRDGVVELIPALRRFARRFCRNPCDADDLVQDTLLKALAAIDTFEPDTKLKSWMFTIMRNAHHTQYVRNKRFVAGLEDIESLVPPSPPSQEWTVRAKEFQLAFNALSDTHQAVIDQILFDGQSYEAVAARSNCPSGTVKSRVNRAREQLAFHLHDTVSAAAAI
jgi:RNA polymerase sigma-70 factor, ECF subfamily